MTIFMLNLGKIDLICISITKERNIKEYLAVCEKVCNFAAVFKRIKCNSKE